MLKHSAVPRIFDFPDHFKETPKRRRTSNNSNKVTDDLPLVCEEPTTSTISSDYDTVHLKCNQENEYLNKQLTECTEKLQKLSKNHSNLKRRFKRLQTKLHTMNKLQKQNFRLKLQNQKKKKR